VQAKLAKNKKDMEAREEFEAGRFGSLAFDLLQMREFKLALRAIQHAVSHAPGRVWLRLIHAHALMLNANISGALKLHRENYRRRLETGGGWGAAIRSRAKSRRAVGVVHPTIMPEIERQFAANKR
jgi:hypothetical protein